MYLYCKINLFVFFNDVLINFTNKAITCYLPTHHINGVMVKVLDTNVGSSLCRVKPKTIHLVFTASPLSTRKSARLECDGSWVQGHVGSNQRLYI
jgi:hypothetical protein